MRKSIGSFKKYAFLALLTTYLLTPDFAYSQVTVPMMLLDFENKYSIRNVSLSDAKIKLLSEGQNHALKVTLGHKDDRPSVKFAIPVTDLSNYIGVAMDIKNPGSSDLKPSVRKIENSNEIVIRPLSLNRIKVKKN